MEQFPAKYMPTHHNFTFSELDEQFGVNLKRQIFVIQNGNSISFYEEAPVNTLAIISRALTGLLNNQLNRDVERIYFLAKETVSNSI